MKHILFKEEKIMFIIAGFLIFCSVVLPAQTAAELETVLMTPAVTRAQAARFVIASITPESEADPFSLAVSRGWLKKSAPDKPIKMGELSLLIMKAFNIKGGMMYSVFPSPRYAFRTMTSRSLIQGASDPAMTMNGERFLLILGRVLSYTGDDL